MSNFKNKKDKKFEWSMTDIYKQSLKPIITDVHLKKTNTAFPDENLFENLPMLNRGVNKPKSVGQFKTPRTDIISYIKKKVGRSAQMDLQNKDSYIANPEVKKKFDLWKHHLDVAKNPKTIEDRIESKNTRLKIMKDYSNFNRRKSLGSDELKLIGKHKSQLPKPQPIEPIKKSMDIIRPLVGEIRNTPEVNLNDILRDNTRFKPGITKDLIALQSEIKKNTDYVLGKNADNSESRKLEPSTKSTKETN